MSGEKIGSTITLFWGLTDGKWVATTEKVKEETGISEYWYTSQLNHGVNNYVLRIKTVNAEERYYVFNSSNCIHRGILVTSPGEHDVDFFTGLVAPTIPSVTTLPIYKEEERGVAKSDVAHADNDDSDTHVTLNWSLTDGKWVVPSQEIQDATGIEKYSYEAEFVGVNNYVLRTMSKWARTEYTFNSGDQRNPVMAVGTGEHTAPTFAGVVPPVIESVDVRHFLQGEKIESSTKSDDPLVTAVQWDVNDTAEWIATADEVKEKTGITRYSYYHIDAVHIDWFVLRFTTDGFGSFAFTDSQRVRHAAVAPEAGDWNAPVFLAPGQPSIVCGAMANGHVEETPWSLPLLYPN